MASTVIPGAVPRVKGLNCPNCGATLTLRAGGHTLTVVCESCHSILDARDPNLQVLQKFEAKVKIKPLIPLGSRGTWAGYTWEVIGFQVRTIVVEGISYSWREYLLFNPYKGFRYLTEYNGHWNFVRPLRSIPQSDTGLVSAVKPVVTVGSDRFKHFQTATAKTTFVLGEFPWQARVGESVEARDFVCPPKILSAEIMETGEQGWTETAWSVGEYTRGDAIWKAFKLPGSAPKPEGIFANQPSPYAGRVWSMWKLCLLFIAGIFGVAILAFLFTSGQEVFRQTYSFAPRAGETSFVTDVFELKGRRSTVEVSTNTNLDNNWAFFSYALINDDTGQAWDFGREVSYYYGRDSDGSWSEGGRSDSALIPSVPPGRYYLRIEPEMQQGSVDYEVRIRRDVPSGVFFIIPAVLLLIPPIFISIRAAAFEGKRWQESDYATSSSDDDDDDDDD